MEVFPFTESILQPYTFNPTMDQRVVAARVVWSLFGKRYYLRMSELTGTPIFLLPVIGSLEGFSVLSLNWLRGQVYMTTTYPHDYRVGSTLILTIRGCAPNGYNGRTRAYIPNPRQIIYNQPIYPGQPLQFGFVNYDINIAAGYFNTSRIVYRTANRQFEVSP
jgi:hypothetical protein